MTPQALAENKIEALHLLVISREPAVLGPLASLGESNRWTVETAASGWDAMERLQSGGTPQLLLLDLPRGDHDNLHMLRWLRRLRADLPVIAFCDAEADETRKEATRLGAEEILSRPVDEHQLESVICKRLGAASQLKAEMMSESVEQLDPETSFVSASPVMRKLRAQADLLAQADVPVLIHGEAGSGKETVARLIHKLSVRSGFRFLNVNCAAMPGDLLESELFGGGPAKAAEKGTIFLDEIAEMPGKLQVRLLEALQNDPLQNHELRPAQAVPPSSSARILAATSADLERVLAEKKLREDLYYRLSAFTVRVPPLRQRKEEITILLRYSMHQMARHYGLPAREFTSVMLSNCQNYSWPGNLSELESFVKRYLVSGDQGLPPGGIELQTHTTGATRTYRTPVSTIATPERSRQESPAAQAAAPQSLKLFIQGIKCEAEKNAIGAALEKTGWNRKAAARLLKVSYRTLLYKIEQYQMTASLPSLSATSARYGAEGNENKESGR